MKLSVYAGTALVIETKNERIAYPKGAFLQLEVDKNDDPIIVHHRLVEVEQLSDSKDLASKKVKVNTIETKYLRFTRLEDLKFIAENIFFEDQFSPVIGIIDTTMADALLKEGISPDLVTAYLSNKESSLQKSYVKDGITHVRIPVKPLAKDVSVMEKLKTLSKFDRIDTSKVKVENINIISVREKNRLQDTRYLVISEALYGDIDNLLLEYVCDKIIETAPKDWKVRVVDSSIRATINGAPPYSLYNILETIPISLDYDTVKKDEDSFIEITVRNPDEEKVIESFYTKLTPHEDFYVEDDGKDEKKEGDPCQADGKKGRLKKSGDSFVCMVEESYEDDLDLDEVFLEGDPCGPDNKGVLKLIEKNLCCVVEDISYTQHYSGYSTLTEQGKEGDACEKDGKKGELCKVGDNLVCKIKESKEQVLFTCLAEGEAMPCEGDPCEMHGQPGKLMMINGALICSLGGDPPTGADRGAGDGGALESVVGEKKSLVPYGHSGRFGAGHSSPEEIAATWGGKKKMKKWMKKVNKDKSFPHDPDDD
jgi:hypothetical protein